MGKDKTTEDDEQQLLREMMRGVKPLPASNRVLHRRHKPSPRRKPHSPEPDAPSSFIEHDHVQHVAAEERLFFARPGLQHRAKQRLKRGDIAYEARLDLHGHTIAEAGDTLSAFLREARQHQCRCVLVVHGKGQRSAAGKPILKAQINHWLQHHEAVLAFSSAQARHGGSGAVYVLLRSDSP